MSALPCPGRRWLVPGALLAAAACAPATPAAEPSDAAPVDLALTTADGEPLRLSQLRGGPLLIFVFTTYDDVSQLALGSLEHFLSRRPQLRALGLAVQPNPQALLQLYRDTLDVSFKLAFDPEDGVVAGGTDLGPIETVPTYLLLGADGRLLARHTGALDEPGLETLCAEVIEED